MKPMIIGTGFVAQAYMRCLHYLGFHPSLLSRAWVNYTDPMMLRYAITSCNPDVVINCAGYTGDTVDDCENNRDECVDANSVLVETIASECHGRKFVHISSGCIFNGVGPFSENDPPNFTSGWYQQCKLAGEKAAGRDAWIFRIRMPFSHIPHRRNWLCKLMKYERILDGLNSVTWIDEFAMRSWQLVEKSPPGIYHTAQRNPVRTMDIARMLKPDAAEYDPSEFIKNRIPRSGAVLDSSKFEKSYGTEFTDTMVALRWCVSNLQSEATNADGERSGFMVDRSAPLTMSAGASASIG